MAKKDRVSGILLFIMFAAAFVQSLGFPKQSAYFPRLICAAGMALCAILVVRSLREKTEGNEEEDQQTEKQKWIIAVMTGLIVLYSIGMNVIGFVAATVLFIIVSGWILYPGKISMENKKPAAFIFASAVVLTLLIWYVFKNLLFVPLPTGLIFG